MIACYLDEAEVEHIKLLPAVSSHWHVLHVPPRMEKPYKYAAM